MDRVVNHKHNDGATIAVKSVTGGAVKKELEAGKTYTVTAEKDGKKFSGSFTVKDTQAAASARINKVTTDAINITSGVNNTVEITEIRDILRDCVTISHNGTNYSSNEIEVDSVVNNSARKNSNSVYIGVVMIKVKNNKGVYYTVPVTINATFTK